MIWRSTLVFLTSLTALTLPVESLRAEAAPLLLAQSTVVDPGQAIPSIRGTDASSPLQNATSEQQVEEIKAVQRELKNRGYYNGPIDGIYGPVTAEAIQTLRGQQGGQPGLTTPRLFTPDSVPAGEISTPAAPVSQQPGTDSQESEQPEVDGNTIGGSSADDRPKEITIGEEVSPETGVEPATKTASDATAATSEAPSPGLGQLLWPGLALIAALGSFGIGFILANRVQGQADDAVDGPWGGIPEAGPQPEPEEEPQRFSQSSQNGHRTVNGTVSESEVDILLQASDVGNSLPAKAAAEATTRLAKVNVIDELVVNLQVADPAKRRKTIWELGQRGNSSAVQHLVNAMVDADSKEKSLILAALSEIGIRSLKPMNRALAIALQDDNPDVRKNAIRDLTRVYDLVTQISQMLGHATEDEDPEVRRTAEWAMEQLNRIREAPKLKSSLSALEASRSSSELLPDEVENLKN